MRIAGRPAAVSSAMVEAPARPINRCASASLSGHVLDIGHELGGNAELGILRADPLDVVGPALLDDLQAAAERGLEHAEALGHDLAEDRSRPGFRR